MKKPASGEAGGARLKLVLFLAVVAIVSYCGYKLIPLSYQAYSVKDLMQHDVDVAATMGHSPTWVAEQLQKSGSEYGLPANTIISPANRDGRVEVRVQYQIPVEFPGYTYLYEFDETVRSASFLNSK